MIINYCDLCGQPLKETERWILYLAEPSLFLSKKLDYYSYIEKVEKEAKEVCPTCKHVFDKMFELRLTKLCELTDEILKTFNLPTKKNPKERKNDKEKK